MTAGRRLRMKTAIAFAIEPFELEFDAEAADFARQAEAKRASKTAGAPPSCPVEPSSALIRRTCFVLDHFQTDSDALRPLHSPELFAIGTRIVNSLGTAQPIKTVHIVGHADSTGSAGHNREL